MRKWIIDTLYDTIKNTNMFKIGYKNVIPPVQAVNRFPAFAIAFDKESRERKNFSNCQFENELRITIILYNQGKANNFDDIMSNLINSVENAINESDDLQNNLIDIYVDKIIQDGGLIHPKALAELQIVAYYRN